MAKYLVNVTMSSCVEVEVEAQNEEEARSLAFEEADPFMVDEWDYDIDSMEREDDEEGEDEDWWAPNGGSRPGQKTLKKVSKTYWQTNHPML